MGMRGIALLSNVRPFYTYSEAHAAVESAAGAEAR